MRQKILRGPLRSLVIKEDQKWLIGVLVEKKIFHKGKIWSTKKLLTLAEAETSVWKRKADVFIFWKWRNSCTAQKAINLWNKSPRKVLGFQFFNDPRASLCAFLEGVVKHRLQLSYQAQHNSNRQGRASHRPNWTRWSGGSFWMCSLWTCKLKVFKAFLENYKCVPLRLASAAHGQLGRNQCFNNKNKRFNYAWLAPTLFKGYWHFYFHWLRTCCEYHLDQEDWWHFERTTSFTWWTFYETRNLLLSIYLQT